MTGLPDTLSVAKGRLRNNLHRPFLVLDKEKADLTTLLTLSGGIARATELEYLLAGQIDFLSIKKRLFLSKLTGSEVVLGWGKKSNTAKANSLAQKYQLPYWALEDGFISLSWSPGSGRSPLLLDC